MNTVKSSRHSSITSTPTPQPRHSSTTSTPTPQPRQSINQ